MDQNDLSIEIEDAPVIEKAPIIWTISCDEIARRVLVPAALAASFAMVVAVTMGVR